MFLNGVENATPPIFITFICYSCKLIHLFVSDLTRIVVKDVVIFSLVTFLNYIAY